jgi:GPI mannosyltransferase 2
MILIWEIVSLVHRRRPNTHSSIASVAALLYIVSPAGIFLSAPYSESPFAFRSILGLLLYLKGVVLFRTPNGFTARTWIVLAGAVLGQAVIVRSNGIFAGLLFAVDALDSSIRLIRGDFTQDQVLRLVVLILGGIFIGIGMVAPQYDAYDEYCTNVRLEERRTWCGKLLPSIYTFVQSHYW